MVSDRVQTSKLGSTAQLVTPLRSGTEKTIVKASPLSRSLRGKEDWEKLVTPSKQPQRRLEFRHLTARHLDPELRKIVIEYGEITQICYDSFFGDRSYDDFGCNKYPVESLIFAAPVNEPQARVRKYKAVRYLYADSSIWTPFGDIDNRLWIGYVAVGPMEADGSLEDPNSMLDVAFAWRGTVAQSEWAMDFKDHAEEVQDNYKDPMPEVCMAKGFRMMYMHSPRCVPPQEQVRMAMVDIYKEYGNRVGSLTACGHSLGGALATVCSFDLAAQRLDPSSERRLNERPDGATVPVTAFTYAAPRVGNRAFREKMKELDVKVLRVRNIRDVVPRVPGLSEDELKGVKEEVGEDKFEYLGRFSGWGKTFKAAYAYVVSHRPEKEQYVDVGTVVEFDTQDLEGTVRTGCCDNAAHINHNLEVLMHLVDPTRDIALMNKSTDALDPSLPDQKKIPPCWNEIAPYKGMWQHEDGTWRRDGPVEEPDETASPAAKQEMKQLRDEQIQKSVGQKGITPTMAKDMEQARNPIRMLQSWWNGK